MWLFVSAHAHVGDVVSGIDLEVDGGQARIEASYGLVLPEGDTFRWVCHEVVTEPGVVRSPRYDRSSSGEWLAWLPDPALGRGGETLFRSSDGCDWPAVPGLGVVTDARFDPLDPQSALATSGTPGVPNTIWSSSDGGRTFTPAFPPVPDRRFLSVAMGDGERWATAADALGGRLFLWHQPTGGVWVEHPLPEVEGPAEVRVLTPGAPGEVWLVLDPQGADSVLRARADGTSSTVLAENVTITDGAWDGTQLWVVQDGVFLLSLDADGGVTEHPEYPLGLGIAVADGALWTAPHSYLVDAMLARSTDGAVSFETLAYPDDVLAPLSCPAGSDLARVCEPLWDQLLPRIRGYDEPPIDTGTAPEPEIPPHLDPVEEEPPAPVEPGCGCGAGAGGGWLGVALVVWVRRRSAVRR